MKDQTPSQPSVPRRTPPPLPKPVTPSVITTIVASVVLWLFVPLFAGLFVKPHPDGAASGVSTFLELHPFVVTTAMCVITIISYVHLFRLAKRYTKPRWYLPIIMIFVSIVVWFGTILLTVRLIPRPTPPNTTAPELIGSYWFGVCLLSTIAFIICLCAIPKRTSY